jgi:hypothetical protein
MVQTQACESHLGDKLYGSICDGVSDRKEILEDSLRLANGVGVVSFTSRKTRVTRIACDKSVRAYTQCPRGQKVRDRARLAIRKRRLDSTVIAVVQSHRAGSKGSGCVVVHASIGDGIAICCHGYLSRRIAITRVSNNNDCDRPRLTVAYRYGTSCECATTNRAYKSLALFGGDSDSNLVGGTRAVFAVAAVAGAYVVVAPRYEGGEDISNAGVRKWCQVALTYSYGCCR